MKRYDLQVHTNASPCSRTAPADVVAGALRANLDGIAITDHDTLDNYAEVKRLAPEGLTVIPGVEVTTTQGHLLALDVRDVPPQADPLTVIDDIHDQGGLAVLSHPFDRLRQYYTDDLDRIAASVDGVEIRNSRCVFDRYNRTAEAFAERYDIAVTGGSDAHFPMELGRAVTLCDDDVLASIRAKTTHADGRGRYVSGHVATKVNDALRLVNR